MQRKIKRLGATFDKNNRWYTQTSDLNIGEDKPNPDLNIAEDKPNPDLGVQQEEACGGIDLSVCNLKKSPVVARKMQKLVSSLSKKLSPRLDPHILGDIFSAHAVSQSYFNKDFTDLYDFCRALQSFCSHQSIKIDCQAVMDAISGAQGKPGMCIKPGHVGSDVKNSYGASIFFPWSDGSEWGLQEVIARYKELDFTNKTKWNTFLRTYRSLAHQFQSRTGHFK